MTGPEHYRVAENLASSAWATVSTRRAEYTALAQVHATLALAAAVAEIDAVADAATGRYPSAARAWASVFTGEEKGQ